MQKRGNAIVLFAILGFVILISGGFIYYIKESNVDTLEAKIEQLNAYNNHLMLIKGYIESNIKSSFIDAVITLLQQTNTPNTCIISIPSPHDKLRCGLVQGDYLDQPDPYLEDIVPEPSLYKYGSYALFEGGIPYIQTWLSLYMENNLDIDFSDYEKMGLEITKLEKPKVNVNFNLNDTSITVNYPIKVRQGTTNTKLDYFKYIYDYDMYKFLTFIINMIQGNALLKTDTLNLHYNPTAETEYLVERIAGVDNSYDIIKVTNQNLALADSYTLLSFSFVRENRPPDANSIFFTNSTGGMVNKNNPMLYGKEITLNCPNYKTTGYYADPDEDDLYGNLWYSYDGWKASSLASCGNTEASVTFDSTDSCDVCQSLTCTITDPGDLKDMKFFEDFIVCDAASGDKNSCCGSDGCWKFHEQAGCGPCDSWITIETCTYQTCPGGCGATSTATAVTKEVLYAKWCTECGDCECSNSIVLDTRTFSCPADQSCPECTDGGGEPPSEPEIPEDRPD